MALSSNSTLDDALAQYNDNLSWEGDANTAAAALEAVRFLLVNRPSRIASNNRNVDFESLAEEKRKLEKYLGHASPNVNRCSFTRGRMLT
jgi:hypothetical protein